METAKMRLEGNEEELGNDVMRYTRVRDHVLQPDLLWLGLTYDESSWSHLPDGAPRSIKHLHEIIAAQYDVKRVSLGLLTSSAEEYERYIESIEHIDYARVTIFLHPGFHEGPVVDRKRRHEAKFQTERRAEMSKLRNYVMLKTLREEQHIVWLDADVYRVDPGIIDRMIQHTEEKEDFGILTAMCTLWNGRNYDLNAWSGTRQGPRGWDLNKEEEEKELKFQGQHHVEELIKNKGGDQLVALDTVGATILYMRASLIEQGLNFPHQYTVGTRWKKDGWDGIESEGLCYRARGLKGGRCGVLAGDWRVAHAASMLTKYYLLGAAAALAASASPTSSPPAVVVAPSTKSAAPSSTVSHASTSLPSSATTPGYWTISLANTQRAFGFTTLNFQFTETSSLGGSGGCAITMTHRLDSDLCGNPSPYSVSTSRAGNGEFPITITLARNLSNGMQRTGQFVLAGGSANDTKCTMTYGANSCPVANTCLYCVSSATFKVPFEDVSSTTKTVGM
ncbi:hypothetical protein ANO11243_085220 [Dothideomycetidae sp. 11243]|nr:hypothetical protein ANO11243_085220 [fungal sp. No.11243]